VAAGGQGAPLVPLFHAALVEGMALPLAVLNIGGVANVTWVGPKGEILAFDTGPGNAPIDDWLRENTGAAQDCGGSLARSGRVDDSRVTQALRHEFFGRRPPKSLDRQAFTAKWARGLGAADGAATLTELTAASIAAARQHFPAAPRCWIVCGGGRHNKWLMHRLTERLAPAHVIECDTLGWDGNALEAHAFAYLAVRVLKGLPLSLPSTTGVPRAMPGGRLCGHRD
jgi:anhydro-N-acetylmuramic acid kinase